MKALVYHGPNHIAWENRQRPVLSESTDAIVRITTTSICGTDLHIVKGDVPSIPDGRVLGHEGVGIVDEVGENVIDFHVGDRVVVSVISACGRCSFCRKAMYSHCRRGGWLLGNSLDGTQAEFVRVPFADMGLHLLSPDVDDTAGVMLSCALPTGMECGAIGGQVAPGDTVAIVGVGPVGLATLLAVKLYSPSKIIAVDLDDHRLELARALGATHVINSADDKAALHVLGLTQGEGVDVAIEAVGIGTTFDICQAIVATGGRIANVGVHGKPVALHIERLWAANITLATRLVDTSTTPMLLKMVRSGQLDAKKLVTHGFALSEFIKAYDTFSDAATNRASKVVLSVA